jgi:PIN domain nuclease of toxin-antitoxin system
VRFLLDTHIWLWSALEPRRLTRRVAAQLGADGNELWLSPVSVWETLVLARRKRLVLEPTPEQWVRRALLDLPVQEAYLNHEIAIRSEALKITHRDPADRFLLATAMVHELTLVTADRHLVQSGVVPTLKN